jgi:hypothetical protein
MVRWFFRPRGRLLALALVGGLLSCSGRVDDQREIPDPGPASSLDPSEMLASMTPADYQTLCEWIAGRAGAWNRKLTCTDNSYLSAAASDAACMQQVTRPPTCVETVGDSQDCINAVVAGCQTLPSNCITLEMDCGMPM